MLTSVIVSNPQTTEPGVHNHSVLIMRVTGCNPHSSADSVAGPRAPVLALRGSVKGFV